MYSQRSFIAERTAPGSPQPSRLSAVSLMQAPAAEARRQVFEQAFELSVTQFPMLPESRRHHGKRNMAKLQSPMVVEASSRPETPVSSAFPVQIAQSQAPETPHWHFAPNTLSRQRKDESHLTTANFRPVLEADEAALQSNKLASPKLSPPPVSHSPWRSQLVDAERKPASTPLLASIETPKLTSAQDQEAEVFSPELQQPLPRHNSRNPSPLLKSPPPDLCRRNATRLSPSQYVRQIFRRLKFWRRGRRPMFPKAFLRRKASFIMAPDRSTRRFRFKSNKLMGKTPHLNTENVARPQMSSLMKLTDPVTAGRNSNSGPAVSANAASANAGNTCNSDRPSTPGRTGKLSLPPRAETAEPRWSTPAPGAAPAANKSNTRPDQAEDTSAPPRPPRPERSKDLPPLPIGMNANQISQPAQLNLEDSDAVARVAQNSNANVLENAASAAYVSAHARGLSRASRTSRRSRASRAARKPMADEDEDVVDDALEFVSVWGSYLRHSIAIRALLRKEILSLEQEEAEEWSNPESDASSVSSSSASSYSDSVLSTVYSDISHVPDLVTSSTRSNHDDAIAAARAALESRGEPSDGKIDLRRPSRRVSHLSRMPERYSNLFSSDQESVKSTGEKTPEKKQEFWAAHSADPAPVEPPTAISQPEGDYSHLRRISTQWAPTKEYNQRGNRSRSHSHGHGRNRSSVPSVIIPRYPEEEFQGHRSKAHARYSSAAYSRDYSDGVLNLSTWRSFSSSEEIPM